MTTEHITGEQPAIGENSALRVGLVIALIGAAVTLTAFGVRDHYRIDTHAEAIKEQKEKGGAKDVTQDLVLQELQRDRKEFKKSLGAVERTNRAIARKLNVYLPPAREDREDDDP